MRVLVTGASGRIGANVVKHLADRGDTIRCVVRANSPRRYKLEPFGVEFADVALTDRERLAATVEDVDAIIHLGAQLGNTSNADHLDVNTIPTLTLLEAVRTRNPGLERFVYGSSDTLFPHSGCMPGLITMDDIFRKPRNMYAVSKHAGGAIVDCYHQQYGIPTVIIYIPYTFCGREFLGERTDAISPLIESHLQWDLRRRTPDPGINRAIEELQGHLEDGKQLVVPRCPEGPPHKHHLGDVRDVARAIVMALDSDTAVGDGFVVMSKVFRMEDAVPHLAEVTGLKHAEVTFPYAQFYEYDLQHTEARLGFSPQYDGKQMLEDAWRQKHGEDIDVVDVGPDARK